MVEHAPKNSPERREAFRTLSLTLTEMLDSEGKPYFALPIPQADIAESLAPYMKKLREHMGAEAFTDLTDAKSKRDGDGEYHITVFTPLDMGGGHKEAVAEAGMKHQGSSIPVVLHGIGCASKLRDGVESTAYYVIVSSEEVDAIRAEASLPPHSLHITLGFSPKDVHGVSKGAETEIIPVSLIQ